MADTVVSTIRYAQSNSALEQEKGYILNYSVPAGTPKSNFSIEFYPGTAIHNLRRTSLPYATSGLTYATLGPSYTLARKDFADETKIERQYLPEVHRCLRETLGAAEVHIFDYMVRRRDAAFPYQPKSKDNAVQPALSAHIDYTEDEIAFRLQKYFGDKAPELGKKHFQIVNTWKPLFGPLRDYPMAYCDARTMDPERDLLAVDEVFPTVANEVYQVLHNPGHKWYYLADQMDNEIAIFVGYDSQKGEALSVPHCSFDLGTAASGEPRESIEVRAFAFYA